MNDRTSPIQAAKARHRLADVVARTGIIVPSGRSGIVTVRCPLPSHGHPDRTPSMRLHLERDLWWCFACSPTDSDGTPKAGDVIGWVRQAENVDWPTAITILDSRQPITNAWAGAALSRANRVKDGGRGELPDLVRSPAERIQLALESAWTFYTAKPLHNQGVEYLARRGIDVDMLERHNRRFEVGHTPNTATGLVDWMRQKGFSPNELVDAGLAHHRPGDSYSSDYYRQRVLIPVRDRKERMAGFVGRNVGDSRFPKYTNPPRTVRYDKSLNLYQPLPAPERSGGRVIVVEGTLDAMAIAVAAIQIGKSDWYCPVTQSGRQLSPRQLRYVLSLHAQPPLIAMDGDQPGRDSNTRLVTALAAMAKTAKVVALPDGEDPASWLATNGAGGLSALSAGAFDLSPAQCRHMRAAIRNVRSPNREVDAPSAMRRAVLGIHP